MFSFKRLPCRTLRVVALHGGVEGGVVAAAGVVVVVVAAPVAGALLLADPGPATEHLRMPRIKVTLLA